MEESLNTGMASPGSNYRHNPAFVRSSLPDIYCTSFRLAHDPFEEMAAEKAHLDDLTAVRPPRYIAQRVYTILDKLFAEQGIYIRDVLDYKELKDILSADWLDCEERASAHDRICTEIESGITPRLLLEPNRSTFSRQDILVSGSDTFGQL